MQRRLVCDRDLRRFASAHCMNWSSTSRRVAIAAYIFTTAFLVAHAINAFIAEALYVSLEYPPTTVPDEQAVQTHEAHQDYADTVLHSGLFTLPQVINSQNGQSGQPLAPPPPPINAAKKVTLLGTVFERDTGVMAVLQEIATNKQSLFRLESQVPGVGVLAAIEKGRVMFREGMTEEWLDLALTQQVGPVAPGNAPPAKARTPAGPERRVLDRREVADALADTTQLLTQAQAIPYFTNGKLDGFRLYSVVPKGFFDKIGLQSNDIVQRINGVELRDPGMLLSLFQHLKTERTVRVDLVRDNTQRQTLTYEIR
jgi:general secretion pathway protein C